MRRSATALAVLLLLVLATPPLAAQTVIDFESVAACDNSRPNMGVFEGVDFLNQWTCYDFAQPPFTPSSGTNRIYAVDGTANAASAFFEFLGGPATFNGAFLAGSTSVMFNMFLDGGLVATSSSLLTSDTPTFLSSGYAGAVDRVEVVGSSVEWILDDLSYTVPEPATLILLGTGLLGLGGVSAVRRRREV